MDEATGPHKLILSPNSSLYSSSWEGKLEYWKGEDLSPWKHDTRVWVVSGLESLVRADSCVVVIKHESMIMGNSCLVV